MSVPSAVSLRTDGEPGRAVAGRRKPIRVCIISPLGYGLYRPSSGYPFGGAEVQLYLLAGELARDPAYGVTVLVTVREEPGVESYGALTVVKRRGGGRLARGGFLAAVSAFRDMLGQLRAIDAEVYLHAGAGAEVGAYALICRLLRRRFVYVVASSADLADANGYVRGPWRGLFPLGCRLAHAIVCRTDEQMRRLKARYRTEGVLIRTGHPVPPISPTGTKSAILWVGRMHPLKQPEMFLDLAERLPNERFVMVLTRDEAHEDLYRSVRTRADGLPNVTLHENIAWQDVGRFFEEAKLFVNTSTYEGFPNTFVQAAMQAVPVLSWAVDPDGVLTRHRIGYCGGGSFKRLAEETERICASKPHRADMGVRAREYAREHHDLRGAVQRWKEMLHSLAAGADR